jgi:hypothetical protein
MENEFECIKIKDGLYLGNLEPAQVKNNFNSRIMNF